MNILFLTQVLPYPLDAGPKIRAYYNLRYLVKKHTLTLVSFVRGSDKSSALSHLKSLCAAVETIPMPRSRLRDGLAIANSLRLSLPFLITRDQVDEMHQALSKLIRREHYDIIHADQLWMAPYALEAKTEAIKKGISPRVILDQHNAVFLIPKRMAESHRNPFVKVWLQRESILMAEYEKKICQEFDEVVWVTQEDWTAVNSLITGPEKDNLESKSEEAISKVNNTVIPICFDPSTVVYPNLLPETHDIIFLGGMHWPPNADGVIWFARDILPLIHKDLPRARFIAVGKRPPNILEHLGENVIIPGYVENTDVYFSSSRVFVVPLRAGGGMRVKILEAWARGIPVVSTTIGAEGIKYSPGTDILIANTPEEVARRYGKF